MKFLNPIRQRKAYQVLFIILTTNLISVAQDTTRTNWIFAEIVGVGKILSNKLNVSIDYGQEGASKSPYAGANRIVDKDGKQITFNSMVDAMNFMGSEGWEFCQAYVVTEPGGLGGSTNVYRWLMKMAATSDVRGNLIPLTKAEFRKTAVKN